MFFSYDAILCVKCTSSSCSKRPLQHDTATPILYSWEDVIWLANCPLHPPNVTLVIKDKYFKMCFFRPDISQNIKVFAPEWICRPYTGFLFRCWSDGVILSE
ncbi:hypothetical protein CHARACLAT_021325 [Characodon lateralis]|uniref:Uncharacterized protein n=1 Tax=Characodon lateralis TaxID=208331 RepID=A0ABU7EMQ4_9TELE|nr:hypothetical protein [Characodon lateralis]